MNMSPLTRLAAKALLVSGLSFPAHAAMAQIDVQCAPYVEIVRNSTETSTPIIPDRLLANTDQATVCLVAALGNLKPVASTTSLPPVVRSQYLSITNALRAIISKLNADDAKAGAPEGNGPGLNAFIKKFRELDDLNVVSILTYGARSDNYEVRSNSLLILANVIDNSTLCVPLDHLRDPDLGKIDATKSEKDRDYSVRGRANLLAVISVVAPWAYRENFDNIKKVKDDLSPGISRSDPNLAQTVKILANLETRLNSQTAQTNQSVGLPNDAKRACTAYSPRWAKPEQLKY